MNRFHLFLALTLVSGMLCNHLAQAQQAESGQANTMRDDTLIETLEVTLGVDRKGDDLDSPVALDLGVGFPFWLHPLGRDSSAVIPFGAVAQRSTASGRMLAKGESATFVFSTDRPVGNDTFGTTRVLMRDLRVSDIGRVGLLSPTKSSWTLESLEVRVNGQPLVN